MPKRKCHRPSINFHGLLLRANIFPGFGFQPDSVDTQEFDGSSFQRKNIGEKTKTASGIFLGHNIIILHQSFICLFICVVYVLKKHCLVNQFETHHSPQSPPHPMHRIPRVVPGVSKFLLKQSRSSARKALSFTCNECWVLTILQGLFSDGLFKRSSDANLVWRLIWCDAWEWMHTCGDVSNSVWPY